MTTKMLSLTKAEIQASLRRRQMTKAAAVGKSRIKKPRRTRLMCPNTRRKLKNSRLEPTPLKKKRDELESEKLKKAGDLDGLIKKERERNAKLTEQLKEVKKQTLKQDLKTQVLKIAPDIHDVDLVTSLPEMKETVQMDHESLTLSNVEEGLAKVRKARPYLFKIQGRAVGPTRLPNPNSGKLGSDAEALEFQQKLFAAKSKPEQEIVRQKYGREL